MLNIEVPFNRTALHSVRTAAAFIAQCVREGLSFHIKGDEFEIIVVITGY